MVFAEQQLERGLSGAARFRNGFEAGGRLLDRADPAGAVNLPPPLLGRLGHAFHDKGKVGRIDLFGKDAGQSRQPSDVAKQYIPGTAAQHNRCQRKQHKKTRQ